MVRVSLNDVSLCWEGDNVVDFVNYLEYQDFMYKVGVLIIMYWGEVYWVLFNSFVGKNLDGSFIVMLNQNKFVVNVQLYDIVVFVLYLIRQ